MPTLSITKTYADGDILTEADLDSIRTSIQTFINTTGLDTDNIQAGGLSVSDIGINDSDYLEFGTGNDGRIGVVSDELIIENVTSDKDILIKANNGGVATTVIQVDASESTVIIPVTDIAVAGSVVRVATLKQFMPVGTILAYSAAAAPTGYLLCDGSAVSRTTYADLFAVIAETAGQGDNVTTFNVPDLRGRFLRGWDNAATNDPDAASRTALNTGGNTGDALFSLQDSANLAHTHTYYDAVTGALGNIQTVGGGGTINSGSQSTGSTGGSESRPKNVNVQYIIKT